MSHGVKYFVWRDGRPRWSPGAVARSLGFRGADLKDERGEWLPMQMALEAAERLNADVRSADPTSRRPARKPAPLKVGYIYFFRGSRHIKIGFSNNPSRRSREFATGSAEDLTVMVAARADRAIETVVHDHFADLRVRGEWFRASDDLIDLMGRVARSGDLMRELSRLKKA